MKDEHTFHVGDLLQSRLRSSKLAIVLHVDCSTGLTKMAWLDELPFKGDYTWMCIPDLRYSWILFSKASGK